DNGGPYSGNPRFELLKPRSVFVPAPFAARHRLSPGRTFSIVAGGVEQTVTVAGLLELSGLARAAGGDLLVADLFTVRTFSAGRVTPTGWTSCSTAANRKRRFSGNSPPAFLPASRSSRPAAPRRPPTGWSGRSAST